MFVFIRCLLAVTLLAASILPGTAQAALMTATVSGTISPFYNAFDAYGNTLNAGTGLAGLAASISITYDSDLMVDLYPGSPIYHTTTHQPGTIFGGTVGQNPVRSASFTVNGVTVNLDVSGPSERGNLQVEDFNPARDSLNLTAGDGRLSWCPNDSQCAEGVGINAYSATVNLFDADGFQPTDVYAWSASNLVALTGSVRMFDSYLCQPAGQGGVGGAAGLCPPGRFDYSTSNTPHWVDFQIAGTQISIAPVAAVPLPAAGWLLATGLTGLAGLRRRRAATVPGRGFRSC